MEGNSRHTRVRAELYQAKREAVKKLREQIAQETDLTPKKEALIQELAAEELELTKLDNTIKQTEQHNAAFDTHMVNRQAKADQIRADFEKNNAQFDKNMEAEMARKSELLKKRREAAKVCKRLTA